MQATGAQVLPALLALVVLVIGASSSTAADMSYCGMTTPDYGNPFGINVTMSFAEDGVQGFFTISVFGTFVCSGNGTFLFDRSSNVYSFNQSDVGSCSELSQLTVTNAYPIGGNSAVLLTGTLDEQQWTFSATSVACFSSVPQGAYCGSAFNVPATVYVAAGHEFMLRIASTTPCIIAGQYLLDGSVVSVVTTSDDCTTYLSITNISYFSQPAPSIFLAGTLIGIPWNATATEAKCP